jgi:hypothetical protein
VTRSTSQRALAGPLIELDHFACSGHVVQPHGPMNELQVQRIPIEYGSTRHSELDIEFAKSLIHVGSPNELTIHRVARQDSGAKETPNVLSVGRRGWGSRVSFTGSGILISRANRLLPKLFSIRGVDTDQHQIVPIGAGQKDPILPNHRRGSRLPRQLASPLDVVCAAPAGRNVPFERDPVRTGASPLGPGFRTCRQRSVQG